MAWQLVGKDGQFIGEASDFPPIPEDGQRVTFSHEVETKLCFKQSYFVNEIEGARVEITQVPLPLTGRKFVIRAYWNSHELVQLVTDSLMKQLNLGAIAQR